MEIYGKRRIVVSQSPIGKKSILDLHDREKCWCRRSRSRCVANFANEIVVAREAAYRDGFIRQLRIL